jgi:hypothetical protein
VHSVYFCVVVHHQGHGSGGITAVIPSAGYEEVGGVIRRHKFAGGGIERASLVGDHRGETDGRVDWKIELSIYFPGVEADPTLQDICNGIESTLLHKPRIFLKRKFL